MEAMGILCHLLPAGRLSRSFISRVGYSIVVSDSPKRCPRHPVIFSDDDWGVQSPPKRIVFRFQYHSQKVIGSLGVVGSI